MTLKQLLLKAQKGDISARNELIIKILPLIRQYAPSDVRHRIIDFYGAVVLRLFRSIPLWRGKNVKSFLHKTIKYTIIKELNNERRFNSFEIIDDETLKDRIDLPDDEQLLRRLRAYIYKLPDIERDVLLRRMSGQSHWKIANDLRTNQSATTKIVRNAFRYLREMFNECRPDTDS